MTPADKNVVFIHGLWLHASSWTSWTELFQTAGYEPLAPGWPGAADTIEETRSNSETCSSTSPIIHSSIGRRFFSGPIC